MRDFPPQVCSPPPLQMNTTHNDFNATATLGGEGRRATPNELQPRYDDIVAEKRLNWTTHYRLLRLLGSGGQGVVYLSERRGADNFTLPVALKIFSPENFSDANEYD